MPLIGESIEVSLVNVDVFVTDRKGERVRGLTRDDFEILENGKPQPVTNFAEYGSPAGPGQSAITGVINEARLQSAPPRQKRTIIVFIDRISLTPLQKDPMFAALKKMLRDSVRPGDGVSIVTWVHTLRTRQEMTDDVAKLDRALDQLSSETSYGFDSEQEQIEREKEWLDEVARETGAPAGDMPTVTAADSAMREKLDMKGKVAAINASLKSISGFDGQKLMLLVTRRFSRIAGKEYLMGRRSMPGPHGSYDFMYDMRKEVESVGLTANANGVRIYPLYPEGLASTFDSASVSRGPATSNAPPLAGFDYQVLQNETEALKQVADSTGGVAAWGPKNVADALPLVEQDLDTYYSLAYRTTASGADGARKIVVKTRQRGLTVRARRQYVEKSDETKVKDRVTSALFGETGASTIPVVVKLGSRKLERNGRYTVPLTITFPFENLTHIPQGNDARGAFSVYIGFGGIWGDLSDVIHRTQPFSVPTANLSAMAGKTFTYDFTVVADVHTDRIVVAVQDELSKEIGIGRVSLRAKAETVE
jgi:VWFA-related protein